MDAPEHALLELHRSIDELKLNGVILLSNIRGKPLTSPIYRPFFEEANKMKLCIFLHPMLPPHAELYRDYVLGPLVAFPFDTTLAVARLCFAGLFRDFPDIRWVIGHLGGAIPYLMERLDNGFRDFPECRANIDVLPSVYLKRLYYDTVSFSPYTLNMARDLVGTDPWSWAAITLTSWGPSSARCLRSRACTFRRKRRRKSSAGPRSRYSTTWRLLSRWMSGVRVASRLRPERWRASSRGGARPRRSARTT
jgi:hypothetical protein